MADLSEFDLKLMPDWLKEDTSRPQTKYADHPGDPGDRFQDRGGPRRDRGGNRDPRGGGGGRGRPSGPGGGSAGRGGDRRDSRGGGGGKDFRGRDRREPREAPVRVEPLNVQVEFLPDETTVSMIVREIKAKFHAYPIFTLARMFLDRPKSHRLKLVAGPGVTLYQAGETGPISSDAKQLEKRLFEMVRGDFYEEKVVEKEAPKGNFTNVAKCRLSGTLLGPTNYHAYQTSLRRLYEERFSRRMSFEEYRREIEVVSDPAAVEAWKEQIQKSAVFVTKKEAEPIELPSLIDAHRHFREHYQAGLIRKATTLEVVGTLGRDTPDRSLYLAVLNAWEAETRFPAKVVGFLRSKFSQEGLHIFKHKKRIVFVTAVRPTPFQGKAEGLSPGIAGILGWVQEHPNGSRKELADALLPTGVSEEELTKAKSLLATDLRWLVHAGHVIEFQNGTLDLPMLPRPKEEENAPRRQGGDRPRNKETRPVSADSAVAEKPEIATVPEVEAASEVEAEIGEVPAPETSSAPTEATNIEVEAEVSAVVETPVSISEVIEEAVQDQAPVAPPSLAEFSASDETLILEDEPKPTVSEGASPSTSG